MGLRIVQVDAFASRPFSGNPAAVCILPGPRDERWMQDVAREMNLAETAFLHQENGGYRLRWFTPAVEVALCGHATLASAHGLWEEGHLAADPRAQAGSGGARAGGCAGNHRDEPGRDTRLRLCVALLRTPERRAGRSRDRVRPLRAGALLV